MHPIYSGLWLLKAQIKPNKDKSITVGFVRGEFIETHTLPQICSYVYKRDSETRVRWLESYSKELITGVVLPRTLFFYFEINGF